MLQQVFLPRRKKRRTVKRRTVGSKYCHRDSFANSLWIFNRKCPSYYLILLQHSPNHFRLLLTQQLRPQPFFPLLDTDHRPHSRACVFRWFSQAQTRQTSLLSFDFATTSESYSTSRTRIRSLSPSFPWILSSIAFSSSSGTTTRQQYMKISSSHPPGLGKQLPRGFRSSFRIFMLVSSSISAAATPTKSPLSSIMPAGASRRVAWMGTRYCSTRRSLPLTSMRIATACPLRKTQLGTLKPSFSVTARMLTKPTFSPNISTPRISIFFTLAPFSNPSSFSTQSWNFLQLSTFASVGPSMCGRVKTGITPTFSEIQNAFIMHHLLWICDSKSKAISTFCKIGCILSTLDIFQKDIDNYTTPQARVILQQLDTKPQTNYNCLSVFGWICWDADWLHRDNKGQVEFDWLLRDNNVLLMSEYFRRYIKKEHYPTPPSSIKFKTTFKNCVYDGFLYREWRQTWEEDWNIIWCEKEQVEWVFEKHRILPHMKINHFRGWYELCRKDMLNKNLKKFKRNLDKQNNKEESDEYDFLPPTFQLPSEYVIFYEEYKKTQNDNKTLWIMKPTSKCQGKGIFIFNKIADISKWKAFNRDNPPEPYVCQRYLLNPLLFGGRKFDMRIYALCTNYQPLTIYLYRAGFARFAHERYDNVDTDNLYKHLTNVAININAPNYVKWIGGKWFLTELKKFMLSKCGLEMTNAAFFDIQRCIIKSLLAVQKLVTNSPNSFELYGFDFIFDSDGKAWLLQVNGGPSMTSNTKEDAELKVGLIDDVMTINNLEGILKGDEQVVGGFDLIYKAKEIGIGSATSYTTMLGCKNNRIDNIKKLARATAFRLAKQFQQKSKMVDSNKKIENKFTIKTSTKIDKTKAPQKTIDSRKNVEQVPSKNEQKLNSNARHRPEEQ